jgi:hypothetical protein
MRVWQTLFIPFCMGLCGIAVAGQENTSVAKPEVTYSKDVAPLLKKNCTVCHRPNDIAPMSLITVLLLQRFRLTLRFGELHLG